MSLYLPHDIPHIELVQELKRADPSFPSNPVRVDDVGDSICRYYPGVHEVEFDNGEVLGYLEKKGAKVDYSTKVASIPQELIEETIAMAKKSSGKRGAYYGNFYGNAGTLNFKRRFTPSR